jgi:hypothetical protein
MIIQVFSKGPMPYPCPTPPGEKCGLDAVIIPVHTIISTTIVLRLMQINHLHEVVKCTKKLSENYPLTQ